MSVPVRLLSRIVPALLVLGCFFLTHTYAGIRHDGVLYLGEALYRLDPARMSQDLFFVFGSQASFSAVPHLYSAVIERLGVSSATIVLLAGALLAYLAAAWWLAKAIMPRPLVAPALIALSILAPIYGGHRVFAYAETFFTARSLAEPLVLIAVGLAIRRRVAWGCVALLVAGLMHPLIALPGCIVMWCWLVLQDRRWAWAALASIVPLTLGALGIAPFDGLLRRYDAQWMTVVADANPFVFPFQWKLSDWATVVFDVGIGVFVLRERSLLGDTLSRLMKAAVFALVIGLGGAIVGADLIGDVLLTGLQLWRVHWLVHWLAVMATVPLVWAMWRRDGPNDRPVALLLVASAVALATFGPIVFMPIAFALSRWPERVKSTPFIVRALGCLCVGLALVLTGRQLEVLGFLSFAHFTVDWLQVSRAFNVSVVLVAVCWLGMRYRRQHPVGAGIAAALLLLLAVVGWDQRPPWTRYQEDYSNGGRLLWENIVRSEDRVYWFREIRAPWLMMRHANYYSPNQASGVLFNRQTAMAVDARGQLTQMLDFQETVCQMMNTLNRNGSSCEPDLEVAKDICRSPDQLGFLVLQTELAVKPVGRLDTGVVVDGIEKRFLLYRCTDLLAAPAVHAK